MGWTHKHRKMRDDLRKAYTDETGRDDYRDPAFIEWVNRRESDTPTDNPHRGAQFCADPPRLTTSG